MKIKDIISLFFAMCISFSYVFGQGSLWYDPYRSSFVFPETQQGINLFELKNKTVIIPPYKNGQQLNNIYQAKALKRNSFKEKFKINVDIYGKRVFVDDVIFLDNQGIDRAICLLVSYEDKQYVLHFPLFEFDTHYGTHYTPYQMRHYEKYDGYFGYLETSRVVDKNNTYQTIILLDPNLLRMLVYEVDEIDHINDSLKDKVVYFGFDTKGYKPWEYEKLLQKPWKYEGMVFPWENEGFVCNTNSIYKQAPVYFKFINNGDVFYYDMYYDGFFMFDTDYLNRCKALYYSDFVDKCNQSYSHQLIHIKSKKDHLSCYSWDSKSNIEHPVARSGVFYCDTIVLAYTDSKDSLYYSYHAIINKINDDNERVEPDLYYPIKQFEIDEVELNSVYQHRIIQKEIERQQAELERIQKEEKEEQEYHRMLVKKYGSTNAKLIENGEVRIGFTKQMCIEAWGEPEVINTTTTENGKIEQWVYGWYSYLYFEGNKLVAIQDQE